MIGLTYNVLMQVKKVSIIMPLKRLRPNIGLKWVWSHNLIVEEPLQMEILQNIRGFDTHVRIEVQYIIVESSNSSVPFAPTWTICSSWYENVKLYGSIFSWNAGLQAKRDGTWELSGFRSSLSNICSPEVKRLFKTTLQMLASHALLCLEVYLLYSTLTCSSALCILFLHSSLNSWNLVSNKIRLSCCILNVVAMQYQFPIPNMHHNSGAAGINFEHLRLLFEPLKDRGYYALQSGCVPSPGRKKKTVPERRSWSMEGVQWLSHLGINFNLYITQKCM